MFTEKIQSFSIGIENEGQVFAVPVEKNKPTVLKVLFSAFNIKLKKTIYLLDFTLYDESEKVTFHNTYNLNPENASFVSKNIFDEYGSSGFQFLFQTTLKANTSYRAKLKLENEATKVLSENETFFNTTTKDV